MYTPEESFSAEINRPMPAAWTGILFRTKVRDEIGFINVNAGPFADGGFVMRTTARFPFVETPGLGGILMAHQESTSGTTGVLSKEWLAWQEAMTKDIAADMKIAPAVKEKAEQVIIQNYRKIALYQVSKGLGANNPEYAEKAAAGLKECGHPFSSLLLKQVIWTYKFIPGFRNIFFSLRKKKREELEKSRIKLNQQYGDSLSFMRNYSS
jgi:hypothetical protein